VFSFFENDPAIDAVDPRQPSRREFSQQDEGEIAGIGCVTRPN